MGLHPTQFASDPGGTPLSEPDIRPVENDEDARDPRPDGPRQPGDDFYCIRFEVWYPSTDCAFRTRFRTSGGCLGCEQGRFNLKRHAGTLRGVRWVGPTAG